MSSQKTIDLPALLLDPAALEDAYRKDPRGFITAFESLSPEVEFPGRTTWQARIDRDKPKASDGLFGRRTLLWLLVLTALTGTAAKLPQIFSWNPAPFYLTFASFFVFPGLAFWYLVHQRKSGPLVVLPSLAFLGSLVFMVLLPAPGTSDWVDLARIHMPIFLWFLSGIVYLAPDLTRGKQEFLRYTGESLLFSGIVLMLGALLAALTTSLFVVFGFPGIGTYLEWVGVYGLVAVPLVGAHLAARFTGERSLGPLFARIFAPLLLVSLTAYTGVILFQGSTPFDERSTLIVFNVMLLIVLAVVIFCLTDSLNKVMKGVLVGLMVLALLLDLIALSAVVYRLGQGGFTPNRLAVLGTNLLILVHLTGVLVLFVRQLAGKGTEGSAARWAAGYLPVYFVWSGAMTFLPPVISLLIPSI